MGCNQAGKQSTLTPSKSAKLSKKEFIKFYNIDLTKKYTILKEIGSGVSSFVYMAIQNSTDERVALKVINKERLKYILPDKKFKISEAAILRVLDHPNIIKCFEVFENERKIFISEEYMEGGNLKDYLKSTKVKLPESKITEVMAQLMSAVNYCHNHKIFHRDIKLENIFIAKDKIKLGDFGFAQKSSRRHDLNVVGTLGYMSPEVLNGRVTEKSDIWACGIVLFMLLSGKYPFNVHSKEELLDSFQGLEKKINDLNAPCQVVHILQGMLRLDPNARFSASEILKNTWLSRCENQEISSKTINNIINFPKRSVLQHAIVLFQTCMFPSNKVDEELALAFNEMDEDKDGVIDRKEFEKFIKKEFKGDSKFITEEFFRNFDLNFNGVIDYSEFLSAFSASDLMSTEKLKKVFRAIDFEEKGYVSAYQIEDKLWVCLEGFIDGKVADTNRVRIEEFVKFVQGN